MSISFASPGSTFIIDMRFVGARGEPLIPKGGRPVVYEIRDPDGAFVLGGPATQDSADPARWFATVTLPDSLPARPASEKYALGWLFIADKERHQRTEFFVVESVGDNVFTATDVLALKGGLIKDLVRVPSQPPQSVDTLNIDYLNYSGAKLYTVPKGLIEKAPSSSAFDIFGYTLSTANLPPTAFLTSDPLIANWQLGQNLDATNEIHFVYIVTPATLSLANDVRRSIDKARNEDINVNLQMTDLDLVHYLKMGMARINATPPAVSDYTIDTVPVRLRYALAQAALYEAMSAQYLAEGVSAFDFGGQSVTLTVDRSQYYESAMGRIQGYLDNELPKIKKADAIAGSPGAVSIQIHTRTNQMLDASRSISRVFQPRGGG